MSLLCRIAKHTPYPSKVRNQRFHFSSCRRCGRDMVRSGEQWTPVPKGFRVVWKLVETSRTETLAAAEIRTNLPVLYAVPQPQAEAALAAEYRVRQQFSFGEIASAGVKLLGWYGADRLQQWRRDHAARRFEQQSVMNLPSAL
jgi:cell division protein FtsZ